MGYQIYTPCKYCDNHNHKITLERSKKDDKEKCQIKLNLKQYSKDVLIDILNFHYFMFTLLER